MVQGDPDCEMIENEIDWSRLIKFILLELQAQSYIPLEEKYLRKKGIDTDVRPIELTVQALRPFIEIHSFPMENKEDVANKRKEPQDCVAVKSPVRIKAEIPTLEICKLYFWVRVQWYQQRKEINVLS